FQTFGEMLADKFWILIIIAIVAVVLLILAVYLCYYKVPKLDSTKLKKCFHMKEKKKPSDDKAKTDKVSQKQNKAVVKTDNSSQGSGPSLPPAPTEKQLNSVSKKSVR
ncbi:hypothetical protein PFISCL1PPCAC_22113, partial [Pristionchus fissidentatus]